MSKKSQMERNNKRFQMVKRFENKRAKLKKIANDPSLPQEEKFQARLKLAKVPRNSSKVRMRSRCIVTGRSRGVYSRFGLSRIVLREMMSSGKIPGITKSSW